LIQCLFYFLYDCFDLFFINIILFIYSFKEFFRGCLSFISFFSCICLIFLR